MATQTSDIPLSSTTAKSRAGSDNLEAEAIGLEVPVRVTGTQLTSVMGTTEHAEPFDEETFTMIVFPRGAVVKLLARVRTGQSVELANLRTNQKISCKIFQINRPNNVVHYVKLEFTQPGQGFWGVHFPSDPLPVTRKQEGAQPAAASYSASPSFVDPVSVPPPPTPASPVPAPERDIFSHAAVPPRPSAPLLNENPAPASLGELASPTAAPEPERDIFSHASVPPRPSAPLLNENPAPSRPGEPASPSAYASPLAPAVDPRNELKELDVDELTIPSIVPSAAPPREAPKFEPPKEAPATAKAPAYGPARTWQKEQIEPLAGPEAFSASSVESAVAALVETPAPAPVAEKIPIPGRRPRPAPARRGEPSAPRRTERSRKKPVRPVYGELHSFNTSPSGAAAPALRDASLNMSSVARSAPSSPRSRLKLFPVLAAVCVLVVVAAGVMYVRRQASVAANSSATLQPAETTLGAPAATAPQPANPPQTAAAPPQTSPAPSPESAAPISPAPAPSASTTLAAKHVAPPPKKPLADKPSAKSSKPAAETHAASNASASDSATSTATVVPNLYAGDLNARPEIKQHAAKRLDAQAPDITVTAPGGAPVSGDAASLGSIVPGGDSATTALAAPAPEVRQGGNVQEPKLITSVPPVYPSLAQQNHVEGDVTIQAMIGISGNVTSMKVISGPVLLREAALNALRKWRYLPAKLDGKPIAQQYVVTIRFRLGN